VDLVINNLPAKGMKSNMTTQKRNYNRIEILLAHSTGISDSYYRPMETELLDEMENFHPQIEVNLVMG
jgi:shikimate 5-dehydrogenase